MINSDDTLLFAALKRKDRKAWDQFYNKYAPAFYGIVTRELQTKQASEETLRSAFNSIFNSLDEFQPEKEKLFNWCVKKMRKEISSKKIAMTVEQLFACHNTPASTSKDSMVELVSQH